MKALRGIALALFFTLTASCVTTSTTSTVWRAQPGPQGWTRPGQVEWIREVVQRQEGNPVGGALAGAVIGGLLGGHGARALVGAAGGAAVGAAVSQGGSETRNYEVMVRFDDGGYGRFWYQNYSPFRPGQPVVMTPNGLAAM
jgi:outer membrane lipoprotein SlyB